MRVFEIVLTIQIFCACQLLLLELLDRAVDRLGADGDRDDVPESDDGDGSVFRGAGPWDWMCLAVAPPQVREPAPWRSG
jgi:hypothetical protein